jgi:5'(3')-deoxyribonucleotidase
LFEKSEWLDKYFPFIGWQYRVLCGYKYIIDADYLIDDHTFNLKTFKGQGILFTSPHNVHENGYPRVNNWAEVKAYFDPLD